MILAEGGCTEQLNYQILEIMKNEDTKLYLLNITEEDPKFGVVNYHGGESGTFSYYLNPKYLFVSVIWTEPLPFTAYCLHLFTPSLQA